MRTSSRAVPARPAPLPRRVTAWLLLGLALLLAVLVVSVAYGFSVEYADTSASAGAAALAAVRDWAIGLVLVVVVVIAAVLVARRSRLVRVLGSLLVVGTVLGMSIGGALGVRAKYDRYPAVPRCAAGFTGGPAVPVVRAAQAAFEELDHPAPFSGGGSSGVDGCASQLMARDGVDPRPRYRSALPAAGWLVTADTSRLLAADRDGLRFELSRDDHGDWWVWIGPSRVSGVVVDR